jgi:HAD superfamily hydrolase (TIGR01509 family)
MKNSKKTKLDNIKAVIFDMDGVIVDTEPMHIKAYDIFFDRLNIPSDQALFHSFVGISIEDNVRHIVQNILKKDLSLAENYIKQRNDIYLNLLKTSPLNVIDGFYDLMEYLQKNGISAALASSSSWEQINIITERLGIRDKFAVLCSGQDVEKTKPAADIYLKAVHDLNISPDYAAAIEDSITGVTAAKNAAVHCIALKNPYMDSKKLEELSDIAVTNLREVIGII